MIALTGTPTLTTDRLELRAPRPEDTDAYLRFYQSDRAIYVGGPKDERAAWDLWAAQFGHWIMRGFGMFVVTLKNSDTPLGVVGHWFPQTRPETEVGWVLFDTASEGQGIAYEAGQACIDHAWHVLKWDRMVSSIALAKRLGAELDADAAPASPKYPSVTYRHRRPQ